jgi:fermentation-respiration switch protein FrsA (DUF1100 family)
MHRLTSAAITAVVVLFIAYLFARYLRANGMFFPEKYPEGMWDVSRLAIAPEDVSFATRDGVNLHGWLIRSKSPSAPLMVFFHGNAGNITERADVAEELAQNGVSVLLFDWRGYGKSAGVAKEEKLYDDALAAYDFAAKIHSDIVIYGESLGAPYAAFVAKQRRSRCVIIDSSFPSLLALGNALYPPLGFFAPRAMRTTDWLNDANVPVLVMHSRTDEVIPFKLGMRLFNSLRVPKEMFVAERASHCGIEAAEPQRYLNTVLRFIGSPKSSATLPAHRS